MKINIYYGGRGLLDDPTLYVLKKNAERFYGAARHGGALQYF